MTLALDQEPLPSALRQLLQPLVRLALARGLPYAALDELLAPRWSMRRGA